MAEAFVFPLVLFWHLPHDIFDGFVQGGCGDYRIDVVDTRFAFANHQPEALAIFKPLGVGDQWLGSGFCSSLDTRVMVRTSMPKKGA